MAKKIKYEVMAVIDIGSNELRLRVAQNSKGKMQFLESAAYPLNLGRDTFTGGKISFEKLEKACEIIKNFLHIARGYGVSEYKIVATTAIRESVNRDYILDQIKIKTGVTVQVIDDSEEKLYIYKLMAHLVSPELTQSALMLYTGAGNVGLAVWENKRVPYTDIIKIGSLRISELFEDEQDYSSQFYLLVEDYVNSSISLIETDIPKTTHFIASGQEISMIADLTGAMCEKIFLYIEAEKLNALFEDIKHKTVDKIADEYNLPMEKAEILLPAVCVYKNLTEITEAKTIITPLVFLSDALMFEMLYPEQFAQITKEFDKSMILSARALARKYKYIEAHHNNVERFAIDIFDKMKKIHGMGKREKLLLQAAAILHDIGKVVNLKKHYQHSYHMIKGLEIIGINNLENEIIAQISLFHSSLNPSYAHAGYQSLSMEHKVLVSKLSAILKIADSLDRSHEQKFSEIDVKLDEGELIITIATDKNIDLEVWAFLDKRKLFEEVFGIKAVIKKKRTV